MLLFCICHVQVTGADFFLWGGGSVKVRNFMLLASQKNRRCKYYAPYSLFIVSLRFAVFFGYVINLVRMFLDPVRVLFNYIIIKYSCLITLKRNIAGVTLVTVFISARLLITMYGILL